MYESSHRIQFGYESIFFPLDAPFSASKISKILRFQNICIQIQLLDAKFKVEKRTSFGSWNQDVASGNKMNRAKEGKRIRKWNKVTLTKGQGGKPLRESRREGSEMVIDLAMNLIGGGGTLSSYFLFHLLHPQRSHPSPLQQDFPNKKTRTKPRESKIWDP